ncbi:RNA polymerase sigma-70 factor [Carboxylicivirga sediminis]|uniref:RNA polymerase sigma factor n=1 Tax=Carboxylicivirga sediminis TaxID=2006564 RepID=A0A941F3A0_9BACT|nr:RNA polymerase sigma-70 factor [Carboxylicivirga sediminis]MBR8535547.1 RNA polymerase sigma-70 factor [Carboxylicivirga sediminis]
MHEAACKRNSLNAEASNSESDSQIINIDSLRIKQIQDGNGNAFNELFNLYKNRVFSFIKRLISNENDAEELTQEVFVKIWMNRMSIDPKKSVNSFIYAIARNTVYDFLRKKLSHKKYIEVLSDELSSDDSLMNFVYYNDAKSILQKLIAELPPQRQKIFLLSRLEGKTYRTIALELGISENTVDTQIRKALRFLKDKYPEITKLLILFS